MIDPSLLDVEATPQKTRLHDLARENPLCRRHHLIAERDKLRFPAACLNHLGLFQIRNWAGSNSTAKTEKAE